MDYKTKELLDKFLEEENVKSAEDVERALAKFMELYNSNQLEFEETPMSKAYDYLAQAEDADTITKARKYARKALEVCPECIDAEVFLAELEDSIFKAETILANAIEKERARLEQEGYFTKENIGCFYGIYETRGYLKALSHLAHLCAFEGKSSKAIEICKEIMRLNNNDNLGVRYLLMGLYAYLEDEKSLQKLYNKYDEESLSTLIPFMIINYKKSDYTNAKLYLDRINKCNKNFIKVFKGTMKSKSDIPNGYFSPGDSSEVDMYLLNYLFLFASVPSIDEFITKNGVVI